MRRVSKSLTSLNVRAAFLSLRVRLLVLALVVLGPLLLERLHALQVDHERRVRIAQMQMLDVARQGADSQDDLLSSARAILQTMAFAAPTDRPQSEACSKLVSDVAAGTEWIFSLSVVSPSGSFLCSSNPDALTINIANRAYFKEAMRTRAPVVSEYLLSTAVNRPIIAIAWPKIVDDKVAAILLITVKLDWINRLIVALSQRVNATSFIVDKTGRLLSRYPSLGDPTQMDYVTHPLVRASMLTDAATFRMDGLDGKPGLFASVKLKQANAWLVVGMSEEQLLGQAVAKLHFLYGLLAAITVAALAGVWWGGDRFVIRTIRRLAQKASAIGRGDYAQACGPTRIPTEFVPLDHALDKMAMKLISRENNLREANRHLDRLAKTDPLTGMRNRRSFDENLDSAWQIGLAVAMPLAVLMIDVDWFKSFNDRYGHVEGDLCLKAVATSLSEHSDTIAARYGGEEFAVLIAGHRAAEAHAVADDIRARLRDIAIAHVDNPSGRVTISIGIATALPNARERPGLLVERADTALYRAKRQGRNTVCVWTAEDMRLAV